MRRQPRDRGGLRLRDVLPIPLLSLFVVVLSWIVVTLRFSRRVVTPPGRRLCDVRVYEHSLAAKTVRIEKNPDTEVRGEYLLVTHSNARWIICGEVLHSDGSSVTRRVLDCTGQLTAGEYVRFTGWRWLTPNAANLDARAVDVPTRVGFAPAWLIERREVYPSQNQRPSGELREKHPIAARLESRDLALDDVCVIHIHGRASRRQEAIRSALVCNPLVKRQLIVSYRNDGDAAKSESGLYTLGATEWRDIEDALRFAREHGARKFILYGWSMGATIALQCARQSRYARDIVGLILDSPALDWANILNFHARLAHVPRGIASSSRWVLEHQHRSAREDTRMSFAELDATRVMMTLDTPIHILHSADDGYVPIEPSRVLAAQFPQVVSLDEWSEARHCKLWNIDPQRYEASVQSWMRTLFAR